MAFDYNALGNRIKQERKALGWTQAHLAARSGVSDSHISSMERGNTDFSVKNLVKVVNALNLSVDKLLYDEIYSAEISCKLVDDIIKDCHPWEIKILADCMGAMKDTLRKYKVAPPAHPDMEE